MLAGYSVFFTPWLESPHSFWWLLSYLASSSHSLNCPLLSCWSIKKRQKTTRWVELYLQGRKGTQLVYYSLTVYLIYIYFYIYLHVIYNNKHNKHNLWLSVTIVDCASMRIGGRQDETGASLYSQSQVVALHSHQQLHECMHVSLTQQWPRCPHLIRFAGCVFLLLNHALDTAAVFATHSFLMVMMKRKYELDVLYG